MPQKNGVDVVFNELVKKYRREVGLFLVVVIFIGGLVLSRLYTQNSQKSPVMVIKGGEELSREGTEIGSCPICPSISSLMVDVSGAVNEPGVYDLDEGSRVQTAIEIAGGLSEEADIDYITKNVNLAKKLADGEKVYIPSKNGGENPVSNQLLGATVDKGEQTESPSTVSTVSDQGQITGPVNINTASQLQLEGLPGIGPVYAQRIIEGRPFSSKEEIMRVKGIGAKTYEKIKEKIVVN